MCGMRRRLHNVLTTLSLVLFTAAAAVWVRSFWVKEVWAAIDHRGVHSVVVSRGAAGWFNVKATQSGAYVPTRSRHFSERPANTVGTPPPGGAVMGWTWAVVVARYDGKSKGGAVVERGRIVRVEGWVVLAATGGLPGLWLVRRVRNRHRRVRPAAAVCANCGYDLRATPDCCPECGTTAAG